MFNPHSDADRAAMLRTVGIDSMEDLFEVVPPAHRFPKLGLPDALTEMEALDDLMELASANGTTDELLCFLGAGAYNHFIPAAIGALISRGEFLTAYTPYQPEVSQGTLQAIFEYQSMVCGLTGMDVSNASHYDGATAAAEAVNMSQSVFRGKRKKIVLSPALHPHYRQTIHTYAQGNGLEFYGEDLEITTGPEQLTALIDQDTALVLVQYPDFFGRVYDYMELAEEAHAKGALLAVSINPMALGLLKPPGEFGADIVTGEGQPLGIPLSYGGPYLGLLATRQKYVRSLAGRLVGETLDARGQRGFVLTLSTREQHIRRERASSNICTNQGLMALSATIYLSLLGKEGLREVAELCYHKAHYAAEKIAALSEYELWSAQPFFNEFVVKAPVPITDLNEHLLDHGIIGGYDLGKDYPELKGHMMFAFTEKNSKDDIDFLVRVLAEVTND
jgi:glycine dehydrogenase subunit 1